METNNLQTFLSVAETGSFTKTAEQNFISSTAVMKQINKVEKELDIKLFNRSNNGVQLTPAGKQFQNYAQQILELSQKSYVACHQLAQNKQIIKLGTSLMHPCQKFIPIWDHVHSEMLGYELQIVQLPTDLTANNREYSMLGKECDIIIGTYDQATIRQLVQAIYLGQYHFEIAMRNDNPLAQKKELSLADLRGQTVLMVPAGVSEKNDELKKQILGSFPDVKIKYTHGRYDLQTFNQTVNENLLLINLTPWKYLHPELVSVPLRTNITVDYGILASKKALPVLNNFLAMLKRLI